MTDSCEVFLGEETFYTAISCDTPRHVQNYSDSRITVTSEGLEDFLERNVCIPPNCRRSLGTLVEERNGIRDQLLIAEGGQSLRIGCTQSILLQKSSQKLRLRGCAMPHATGIARKEDV